MIHKNFGKGIRTYGKKAFNDKVYTPEWAAKKIISLYKEYIEEKDLLYDPFKGKGAFYDNFPSKNKKYWTEIDQGKDFFGFDKKVDWIISNPPYSIYNEMMEHSMKLADNIVYVIPVNKVASSLKRLRQISAYGGVVSIHYFSASKVKFPFGFPCMAIWIKKGYKGTTEIKELELEKNE